MEPGFSEKISDCFCQGGSTTVDKIKSLKADIESLATDLQHMSQKKSSENRTSKIQLSRLKNDIYPASEM